MWQLDCRLTRRRGEEETGELAAKNAKITKKDGTNDGKDERTDYLARAGREEEEEKELLARTPGS